MLLRANLDSLGSRNVMLNATDEGSAIYTQCGFRCVNIGMTGYHAQLKNTLPPDVVPDGVHVEKITEPAIEGISKYQKSVSSLRTTLERCVFLLLIIGYSWYDQNIIFVRVVREMWVFTFANRDDLVRLTPKINIMFSRIIGRLMLMKRSPQIIINIFYRIL